MGIQRAVHRPHAELREVGHLKHAGTRSPDELREKLAEVRNSVKPKDGVDKRTVRLLRSMAADLSVSGLSAPAGELTDLPPTRRITPSIPILDVHVHTGADPHSEMPGNAAGRENPGFLPDYGKNYGGLSRMSPSVEEILEGPHPDID